jgi:16S rRNA (uracil1498-N3)-methyltransferase
MPPPPAAPRLYVDEALSAGVGQVLPDAAARHVQVLRLQPGDAVTLFDGRGGQWTAQVQAIGRREVSVEVLTHEPVERELPLVVTVAVAMPTNDRMDFLVEKATELGAAAIVPLISERSVLRLSGERAAKRVAQWRALATAACEQCGRNRPPRIEPVQALQEALRTTLVEGAAERRLLAWRHARPWLPPSLHGSRLVLLSGPEGGFTEAEEDAAQAAGFFPTQLGPRILRADTAPLAALAAVALGAA